MGLQLSMSGSIQVLYKYVSKIPPFDTHKTPPNFKISCKSEIQRNDKTQLASYARFQAMLKSKVGPECDKNPDYVFIIFLVSDISVISYKALRRETFM